LTSPVSLAAALCAALVVATAHPRTERGNRTVVVHIADFAFRPADTTVAIGDTVVWINDDAFQHIVAADSQSWKSSALASGQRFAFVPDGSGHVPYHCAAHPVMRGVLTVLK
jgi:plastocyanin